MVFKEPKAKWFKDLKENRKEFKNVRNMVDSLKLKYDRWNHLTEWVLGIAIALFLSVSINNLLDTPIEWLADLGFWAYVITLSIILITVGTYVWTNWRQEKAMIWLYREKDKQENG